MPDIDRTADVKVSAGREPVTAEIPLAGHASEHWLELFRLFAKKLQPSHLEASDRDDRTWVIVTLPPAGQVRTPDPDRKSTRLNSSHVVTSRMPSSA